MDGVKEGALACLVSYSPAFPISLWQARHTHRHVTPNPHTKHIHTHPDSIPLCCSRYTPIFSKRNPHIHNQSIILLPIYPRHIAGGFFAPFFCCCSLSFGPNNNASMASVALGEKAGVCAAPSISQNVTVACPLAQELYSVTIVSLPVLGGVVFG